MTEDIQPSLPKRIGGMPPWMQRQKDNLAARSEREELVERMLKLVNADRDGRNWLTVVGFNAVVKNYCGRGTAAQRLGRLYRLEGLCKEAAASGFGYGKCFWVELKRAKKFKQTKLL